MASVVVVVDLVISITSAIVAYIFDKKFIQRYADYKKKISEQIMSKYRTQFEDILKKKDPLVAFNEISAIRDKMYDDNRVLVTYDVMHWFLRASIYCFIILIFL